jgi:hypothetical protein
MADSTQNEPRTIVLIHGLFLTWSSWEKWIERYSARIHGSGTGMAAYEAQHQNRRRPFR